MFKKILIANRGEIALRIIRACKELNIATVAVYSEADEDSLHTKFADEAVCIGPAPATKSYLNTTNIISAAELTSADAVHPGYGFLAENAQFAEVCESCKIAFIGPPPKAIEMAGNKANARRLVSKEGIPIIPGSEGIVGTEKEALTKAAEMEYPVIIKAAAGGGGRGMRIAQNEQDLVKSLPLAKAEAEAAFGNGDIYLEKYLGDIRHIEFQVMADKAGNVIHLDERDCSIQRRHQKLVEEAPSPALNDGLREKMGKAAVKAIKALGYSNIGTVEFLLDKNGKFYFMEINTRMQVEHPVTEMITGIDIAKEQIRLAAGDKLAHKQKEVKIRGHSIEFRINSEDPKNDFMPSGGEIKLYNPPGGPGVRVDSHLYTGYLVPNHYDSLLAKLIVWGENRNEAIVRAERALNELIIVGLETTIPFHLKVVENAFFRRGEVYTDFVSRRVLNE